MTDNRLFNIQKFNAEVNISYSSKFNDPNLIRRELANVLADRVLLPILTTKHEFHTSYRASCYILTDEGLQKLITELHRRVSVGAPIDLSVIEAIRYD